MLDLHIMFFIDTNPLPNTQMLVGNGDDALNANDMDIGEPKKPPTY